MRINDISDQFSSAESDPKQFTNILETDFSQSYVNYLLKVSNLSGTQVQLTNLIVLNDNESKNSFILDKTSLASDGFSTSFVSSDNDYGEFVVETDDFLNESFLKFKPKDPFDTEYDIKFIESKFSPGLGIGSITVGFVDVLTDIREVITGATTSIVGISSDT